MEKYKNAGKKLKVKNGVYSFLNNRWLDGHEFIAEDYWINISGMAWMECNGNPACIDYAYRAGIKNLPYDNKVVYGKIGGLGYLLHESELDILNEKNV